MANKFDDVDKKLEAEMLEARNAEKEAAALKEKSRRDLDARFASDIQPLIEANEKELAEKSIKTGFSKSWSGRDGISNPHVIVRIAARAFDYDLARDAVVEGRINFGNHEGYTFEGQGKLSKPLEKQADEFFLRLYERLKLSMKSR